MCLIDFINDMTPMQRYQFILSLNEEEKQKKKKSEKDKEGISWLKGYYLYLFFV